MKKEPTLVIMAAGMGSRYGGLKQIDPVSGKDEIILDFSLYDAMMAGFKKAVIIIKKENEEDFRKLIDSKAGKHMDIKFAYQDLKDIPDGYEIPEGRVKPWGTSHAVLAARNSVDGPFAVINSDDYYGPGAFQTIYEYLENAEDTDKYHYCMVGYLIENTLTENGSVTRGVCKENEKHFLSDITETFDIHWKDGKIVYEEDGKEVEIAKGTTVSMNFWGFTGSMMDELKVRLPKFLDKTLKENPMRGEYLLPSTADELIKEEKADVKVLKSMDRWYGVTYKEDKESVVNALQSMKDRGLYPEILWR